jgi:hypothetical protein
MGESSARPPFRAEEDRFAPTDSVIHVSESRITPRMKEIVRATSILK